MKKILLIFSLVILVAQPLAELSFSSEVPQILSGNPFAYKLEESGLFNIPPPLEVVPEPMPLVKQLFWKARSFRYTPELQGSDHWQTPEETERIYAGDCEDKAVWLFSELHKHGIQNIELVIGKYKTIKKTLHVWVTYVDPSGATLVLDPSMQRSIWKISEFSANHYKAIFAYDGLIGAE